jgi:acyl-coenzyme A synthetase/AMP-(fatty) acid ligase
MGRDAVGFVVLHAASNEDAESLRRWANARLGKSQRMAAVNLVAELPRSAIGKVLKRELRELHATPTPETVSRSVD